jgi:hypothetical protein
MPRIHVQVKNFDNGEIYFECDFDQSTGVDVALGTNVGSLYQSSNSLTHVSLDLAGDMVRPVDTQLELFSGAGN